MNRYKLECFECDDEVIIICSADIPSYCPFCGGQNLEVFKREEPLEWDEDE